VALCTSKCCSQHGRRNCSSLLVMFFSGYKECEGFLNTILFSIAHRMKSGRVKPGDQGGHCPCKNNSVSE